MPEDTLDEIIAANIAAAQDNGDDLPDPWGSHADNAADTAQEQGYSSSDACEAAYQVIIAKTTRRREGE